MELDKTRHQFTVFSHESESSLDVNATCMQVDEKHANLLHARILGFDA